VFNLVVFFWGYLIRFSCWIFL